MKPAIFIASSSSALGVAEELQTLLEKDALVTPWPAGVVRPSEYPLIAILDTLPRWDYGIFIFAPNDILESKGKRYFSPRDNVVFELGVFIGRLGKDSCFIVVPEEEGKEVKIPSDLHGLTVLLYDANRSDRNLAAALGPVARDIKKRIREVRDVSVARVSALEEYLIVKHKRYRIESDFIKKLISVNEAQCAQFFYLCTERHNKLKKIVRQRHHEANSLKSQLNEFNNYINGMLDNVWILNVSLLLDDYYKNRCRSIKPRACLKMHTDDPKVIRTFLYSKMSPTTTLKAQIDTNTGLLKVFRSGNYFLCNNIPAEVSLGRYINSRIDLVKAQAYQSSEEKEFALRSDDKEDQAWQKCWRPVSTERGPVQPEPDECYKSTLIIPLTLLNKELDAGFRQRFEINNPHDQSKSIYGYLCLDHQHTDFFLDAIDVNIGFAFADLLSLYMILRLNYTKYSQTYRKAHEILRKIAGGSEHGLPKI